MDAHLQGFAYRCRYVELAKWHIQAEGFQTSALVHDAGGTPIDIPRFGLTKTTLETFSLRQGY